MKYDFTSLRAVCCGMAAAAFLLLMLIPGVSAKTDAKISVKKGANAVATKSAASKRWTLKQLIAYTVETGDDRAMNMKVLAALGYTSASPTRYVAYDFEKCLHMFSVVLGKAVKEKAPHKPVDIFISKVCVNKLDDGKHVAGTNFRATLDGDLLAGMRGVGRVGDVVQTKLDTGDPSVNKQFKALMAFFVERAPSLPRLKQ